MEEANLLRGPGFHGSVAAEQLKTDHSRYSFVFQLPRDDVQRSRHLLMCRDKTPKKPQNQDDDADDASEIEKHEKAAESCHDLRLHNLMWSLVSW